MQLLGTNITRDMMPSYTTEEAYPEKIDAIKQQILNAKLQGAMQQQQPNMQLDLGNKMSGGQSSWQ